MISVIIPVLNEEKKIGQTLNYLNRMKGDFEVFVVDGGSRDKTVNIAKEHAHVIASKQGRAVQMNTGAGRAGGDVLFFLHADCRPEGGSLIEIDEILKNPKVIGGALRYDVENKSFLYRNHVYWSSLRARLTKVFLGDHGLFVRRTVFDRVGGYPDIPLMEDVGLCKKLRREGGLVQGRSRILSSTRRFEERGFASTVFRMWTNRTLYALGVSPERLARGYPAVR